MEINKILQYLLAWGLLVLFQSIFINGVYQSATGDTKKRVDGTDEDSEMILYWLKKFFEKRKEVLYQYKYNALAKLIFEIIKAVPELSGNFGCIEDDRIDFAIAANKDLFYKNRGFIYAKCNVKIVFSNNGWCVKFYQSVEEYKYSKWLRKPIIQCIKCMSSFWGALTFWPVVLCLFGFNLLEIPIFFADVFSLTYLNWIIYLKAQSKH